MCSSCPCVAITQYIDPVMNSTSFFNLVDILVINLAIALLFKHILVSCHCRNFCPSRYVYTCKFYPWCEMVSENAISLKSAHIITLQSLLFRINQINKRYQETDINFLPFIPSVMNKLLFIN